MDGRRKRPGAARGCPGARAGVFWTDRIAYGQAVRAAPREGATRADRRPPGAPYPGGVRHFTGFVFLGV